MPFSFLCGAFEEVSNIKGASSKEKQREVISRMLRTVLTNSASSLEMTYYLCTLRLAPDYLDKELGIGDQYIIKAIGKTSGRTAKQVKDSLTSLGDLGKVALFSRQSQRSMDAFCTKQEKIGLTVQEVFSGL